MEKLVKNPLPDMKDGFRLVAEDVNRPVVYPTNWTNPPPDFDTGNRWFIDDGKLRCTKDMDASAVNVQGGLSFVSDDEDQPIANPCNWHNTVRMWNPGRGWVPGDDDAGCVWKRGDGFINYVRYVLLGHTPR